MKITALKGQGHIWKGSNLCCFKIPGESSEPTYVNPGLAWMGHLPYLEPQVTDRDRIYHSLLRMETPFSYGGVSARYTGSCESHLEAPDSPPRHIRGAGTHSTAAHDSVPVWISLTLMF